MRARSAAAAAAFVAALAPALVSGEGALAGSEAFTISVDDASVALKESFTVSSSSACPSSPYTVTFVYTTHDAGQASTAASGTTSAEGAFSQVVTVPEAATAEQPASVQASVTCAEGGAEGAARQGSARQGAARQGGGATQTSNTVNITVVVATGVLSTDKTQGRAGTVVQVSGTNCLGDEAVVVFGDESGAWPVAVTVHPDDTFAGSFAIPPAPPGAYFFAASCPGTDYADRAFTVLATPGLPTAGPPAPVPGAVDYTG